MPHHVEELFPRALAAQQAGDLDAAEQDYRQILALDPNHSATLTNLGALLVRRGRLEEASQLYLAVVGANPNFAAAHFNLGNLYRQLGRPNDAAKSFHQVTQLFPGYSPAHLNLGLAFSDSGNWTTAAEQFGRAVELDPNVPEGLSLLGNALTQVGRTDEAIAALRELVRRSPEEPRSYHSLGLALMTAGKHEEAIAALEHALRLRPDYPAAHNALGIALDERGRPDEAHVHYREAVRLEPGLAEAWSNLGISLREQGRIGEAIAALEKALELRPDPAIGSNRLLTLISSDVTPKRLHDEHEAWAAKYAAAIVPAEKVTRPHDSGRPLKIGYVFGEFQSRAASAFLETLLIRHDRTRVHVTCYPNTIRGGDALTRLRLRANGWRSLVGVPGVEAVELIRADEIDVLVDLCGHLAGNRLRAFAQKPARVQATLFGYPCTTGLRTIDFRMSDGVADPPGADSQRPEKVLRLPGVGRLYVPPESSAPSQLPADVDRPFIFGCLNHPGKLSDVCLKTWAKVLRAVPNSRLVLQVGRSVEATRELTDRFARAGLSSDRLELTYRLPEPEYLAAYASIDLALDPFPFNGRTTTCDALWMGVPVLTVAGADCRSRQGVSILTAVGLPDFVADTPEKLIDLAATWANQRDVLADLRETLREMMAQSPVTDADAYVRNLEDAYRTMVALE